MNSSTLAGGDAPSSEVKVIADPNPENYGIWIVEDKPQQDEANIAYCTSSADGSAPTCIKVSPQ